MTQFTFYPSSQKPLNLQQTTRPPTSLLQTPLTNLQKKLPEDESQLENPNHQYNKILTSITVLGTKLSKLLKVAFEIVSSQTCAERLRQIQPQKFVNLLANEIKPFISKFRNSLSRSKVFLEKYSISRPKTQFLQFFSWKEHAQEVVNSIQMLVKGLLILPDRLYSDILKQHSNASKDAINCLMKIIQYSYLSLNYITQFLDLIIHSHYIYQESTIKAICKQNIVQRCILPIFSQSKKIRDIINEVEVRKEIDSSIIHK